MVTQASGFKFSAAANTAQANAMNRVPAASTLISMVTGESKQNMTPQDSRFRTTTGFRNTTRDYFTSSGTS